MFELIHLKHGRKSASGFKFKNHNDIPVLIISIVHFLYAYRLYKVYLPDGVTKADLEKKYHFVKWQPF